MGFFATITGAVENGYYRRRAERLEKELADERRRHYANLIKLQDRVLQSKGFAPVSIEAERFADVDDREREQQAAYLDRLGKELKQEERVILDAWAEDSRQNGFSEQQIQMILTDEAERRKILTE